MFNWATEQLEKLSSVVAPPSTDPASRFVYCVQKNDEAGAQGCLAEMDPLYTIVQQTKGTMPIHLACGQGMVNLIRQIMAIPGASMEVTDAAGNTPLHHACMSTDLTNGPHVVRMLITEYSASVVVKNWQGQTPYDVATLNAIRQYLLPLQLQQETQMAIDNGGVGLPPGIDMGGLRIRNPAMPPPPMGGMGGAPPTSPSNAANGPPSILATPSPNMLLKQIAPPGGIPVAPLTAPQSANAAVPPTSGKRPFERSASTSSAPSSGNSTQRDYARSGSSSAAMLSKAKFRPDGFHSSSSDVSLQKKYGHSSHGMPAPAAVPPPPSSGNSGPPPGADAGTNPYAAGSAAFGSANRYGRAASRYPVYSAVQSNVVAQQSSGGYSGMPQQAPVPSYTMFHPGGQTQSQQQQQLSFEQPQQTPTTPFMSPPPYQQQPQQPVYQQSQQQPTYQQPMTNQQPQQTNAYQQPPAQTVFQQVPVQQPPLQPPTGLLQQTGAQQPYSSTVQPPIPSPYPMTHTVSSISAASAEELFAATSPSAKGEKVNAPEVPASEPGARSVTQDSARSSVSSAHELFSTSPDEMNTDTSTHQPSSEGANEGAGTNSTVAFAAPAGEPSANAGDPPHQTASAVGAAADFFGSNGAGSTSAEPTANASTSNTVPETEKATNGAGESAVESADDGLDDVPLEEVPLTPGGDSAPGMPSQTNAFSSIGLPPPPFSSRQ